MKTSSLNSLFCAFCSLCASLYPPCVNASDKGSGVGIGVESASWRACPSTGNGYPVYDWIEIAHCLNSINNAKSFDDYYSTIEKFISKNEKQIPPAELWTLRWELSLSKRNKSEADHALEMAAKFNSPLATYEMYRLKGDKSLLIKAMNLGNSEAAFEYAVDIEQGAEGRADPIRAAAIIESFAFNGDTQMIRNLSSRLKYSQRSHQAFWKFIFIVTGTDAQDATVDFSENEWHQICALTNAHPRVISNILPVEEMDADAKGLLLNYMVNCSGN